MTKPVTAVATLILLEECVLRLDEPVDELLPELADRRVVRRIDGPVDDTVPADRPITVRDLLTFRMGFGGYFGPCPVNDVGGAAASSASGRPQPALPPEPDEWMRRFSTLPLMCQPGERWLYHTGADVLGVLIARASGQTVRGVPARAHLRAAGHEGHRRSRCRPPTSTGSRPATSPIPSRARCSVFDPPDGQWSTPPAFPGGGAGLVSTADDFLAFAEMLLRGGSPLLSRPSVETMTSDHLTPEQKAIGGFFPDDFDARGWGFGVGVVTRRDHPAAPVGQYGWDGGLGTIWRNDPSEQMTMILLTNAAWTSPRPPDDRPRLPHRRLRGDRRLIRAASSPALPAASPDPIGPEPGAPARTSRPYDERRWVRGGGSVVRLLFTFVGGAGHYEPLVPSCGTIGADHTG